MSTSEASFQDLDAIHNNTWENPFTNIPAIREAINLSDKSLKEVLEMSPKEWKRMENHLLEKFDREDDIVNILLSEGVGTCTTLAVHVSRQAPTRVFTLGDTGHHRVAWTSDGILIDSSACRLVQLSDNIPQTCAKVTFRRRSTADGSSILEFSKNNKPFQQIEALATVRDALKRSFAQIISGEKMTFLFRTEGSEGNGFNGIISWEKGSSEFTWHEEAQSKKLIWTATFSRCGTNFDTNAEVEQNLDDWASREHCVQQWTFVRNLMLAEFLPTLTKIYGCGKVTYEEESLEASC